MSRKTAAPRPGASAGFTLADLLIALGISFLLLAIGTPSMQSMLQQSRARAAAHMLTASLASARMAAVTQRHDIVVCPRAADAICAGDGIWSGGWIVFKDPDRNRLPDDLSQIITTTQLPIGRLSISGNRDFLRYLPDGRSSGTVITLSICGGTPARLLGEVIVNNVGRTRSTRHDGSVPCPD